MALRVGIIGAVSSYSLHYSETFRDMEGVELAGIAHFDRDPKYIRDALNLPWLAKYPKTVAEMAARFECPAFETIEQLFDEGKPDAICICTEDYLRSKYCAIGLEHGMHVFLPKPFAQTTEQALAAFEMSNHLGLVTVGSLPTRFRAPSVTAQEIIASGGIGRPINGHFSLTHHLTLGGWKSDTSMAAGPELETGFYVFDQARMLMEANPKDVVGFGENLDHRGIPYIDNAKCLIRFENDALATIDLILSTHHPFPRGRAAHVVGDEGALVIDQDEKGSYVEVYTQDGVKRTDCETWNPFERELGEWIRLIREGGDPNAWQDESLKTLDLILAYKLASKSGERVTFDQSDQDDEDLEDEDDV
ncbi:MAG: Gfo/Idh/MocA family oxidoreductase [Candidatus Latescibacterota bacterium]|nr:Gfo/Idh/MocA family oxidoreductase [Candidatus Latescibacterota bacterium]